MRNSSTCLMFGARADERSKTTGSNHRGRSSHLLKLAVEDPIDQPEISEIKTGFQVPTMVVPITRPGFLMSTRCRRAVRLNSRLRARGTCFVYSRFVVPAGGEFVRAALYGR